MFVPRDEGHARDDGVGKRSAHGTRYVLRTDRGLERAWREWSEPFCPGAGRVIMQTMRALQNAAREARMAPMAPLRLRMNATSTFRDACPSRVRGCRSAIRRLSEFVSEPCPTVSERLRGVRAVARLCLVCEGTPRITSDIQPCPRTCLGCPSVSEHIQPCPRTCLECPTVLFFEFSRDETIF